MSITNADISVLIEKFGSITPDILKTIGWTPLVRMNKLARDIKPNIFAKL